MECNINSSFTHKHENHSYHFSKHWYSVRTETAVDANNKKADRVDNKFEIIYKPPGNDALMLATSFCSISSYLFPIVLASYAYDRFYEENIEMVEQMSTMQLGAMGASAVIAMIALSYCRSIPLRIYKYENE